MSAALTVVGACAIALLGVLVVGLLRNQRRVLADLRDLDLRIAGASTAAAGGDLVGTSPSGAALVIDLAHDGERTVLAFLSSTCVSCRELWAELGGDLTARLPSGTRVVIVTQDGADERADAVRALAPRRVEVLMSSAAWRRFGVSAAPYFVVLGRRSGGVLAQGPAVSSAEVLRLAQTRAGA